MLKKTFVDLNVNLQIDHYFNIASKKEKKTKTDYLLKITYR